MKCFYHNDQDGYCSGFIVSKYFSDVDPEDFICVNYGSMSDEEILNKIFDNETIIIVDFSFSVELMTEVLKKTSNVIWIDHHKTAVERFENFPEQIKGIRDISKAGCELTYEYFFSDYTTPYYVKLIADYDTFKFNYKLDTKYYHLALTCYGDIKPYDWNTWLELQNVNTKIKEGEAIIKYKNGLSKRISPAYLSFKDIAGYKVACLNNCMSGSDWFGDIYNKISAVCSYFFDGKYWNYSFYASNDNPTAADCPMLAEYVGKFNPNGIISHGGHLHAAGLRHIDYLLDRLPDINN